MAERVARAKQLSFEDLEAILDENVGKRIKLPLNPDDIGGELISILSRGLYTNPLDCIREYVQNSVDANANTITIQITGNSVVIRDNGDGMTLAELLQARQVGLSPKSLQEYVGFRGIGLYSGFDLCTRLRITTKTRGEPHLHVLVFDFGAMRAQLESDKQAVIRKGTPLIALLSEHTRIGRELSTFGADHHFTTVQLEDISDVHIRQISNRSELKQYMLQNLPVDFDDAFEWREIINQHLFSNVPGYHAIKILLQSDGLEDELVSKSNITDLAYPAFGFITSGGQQLAYYWACLNNKRGRIDVGDGRSNASGFVYKVKGFTIGDRGRLQGKFTRKPQLYPWYTGEIYVIDINIVPNTERDDFETNQAKSLLEFHVGTKLAELETEAEEFQAQGVADERLARYKLEIDHLAEQIATNTQVDDYMAFARLQEISRDLNRQRRHVTADLRSDAEELLRKAKSLQRQVRKEVETPTPAATRRRRAARDEGVGSRPAVPTVSPLPFTPPKNLPKLLEDAGWILDGDVARLVDIVQSSLEDVLGPLTANYRNMLNDLEAKLSPVTAEE